MCCWRVYVRYTSVDSKAQHYRYYSVLISKWIASIHKPGVSQEYAYVFLMISKRAINPAPFVMLDFVTLIVSEKE